MTQPLKNSAGTLAEFAPDDRMNVANMPQSLPIPTLNASGVPVLINRTVDQALECAIIRELNEQAAKLSIRGRLETVSLVDRRGSIGLRGMVR